MTLQEKLDKVPVEKNFFAGLTEEEIEYEKLMGKIAGQLILERTKRHMSQKELAEKLGVKQSLISKWESGDNNFTFHQVIKIFSKLGIKVDIAFNSKNEYMQTTANTFRFASLKSGDSEKSKEIRKAVLASFSTEKSEIA